MVFSVICLRMLFYHNNDKWHKLSHRNGILWGLFIYLILRALFYALYLANDEHSLSDGVYFFLIDGPTMLFFLVYTQLCLYWVSVADKRRLDEHRWKRGYLVMVVVLTAILIVNIAYRVREKKEKAHGDATMRWVYGMSIGVLSWVLAACFCFYGIAFYNYLKTLPEGDVRRKKLPKLLFALTLFSIGFVVYGSFIIFGYAANMDYLPGSNADLTHAQESALVFRALDCFLASLIIYIVHSPQQVNPSTKSTFLQTSSEPLLEEGPIETLANAASRISVFEETHGAKPRQSLQLLSPSSPDFERHHNLTPEEAQIASQAQNERLEALGQPLGRLDELSSSGGDFPYDRVRRHYNQKYAPQASNNPSEASTCSSMTSASMSGSRDSQQAQNFTQAGPEANV